MLTISQRSSEKRKCETRLPGAKSHMFGSAIAKSRYSERLSLWRQPRLTTSAVASRIASRPTSSSGLSRPSRAAVGNFCKRRRRTYYLYCTLIYGVHYCHINLSKMLTLTRSLTLTLTLNPNPNFILSLCYLYVIYVIFVSENRNFNIKHKIVLYYT